MMAHFCLTTALTPTTASDFALSRAGANAVMELGRFGIEALLVPFPYATDDHQAANADYLAKAGSARVIAQHDLTPENFRGILRSLPAAAELRKLKPDFPARGRKLIRHYIKFEDIVERVIKGLNAVGIAVS